MGEEKGIKIDTLWDWSREKDFIQNAYGDMFRSTPLPGLMDDASGLGLGAYQTVEGENTYNFQHADGKPFCMADFFQRADLIGTAITYGAPIARTIEMSILYPTKDNIKEYVEKIKMSVPESTVNVMQGGGEAEGPASYCHKCSFQGKEIKSYDELNAFMLGFSNQASGNPDLDVKKVQDLLGSVPSEAYFRGGTLQEQGLDLGTAYMHYVAEKAGKEEM